MMGVWEFPDAVLIDIMSIDFGHVYLLLHNQYKVKSLDKAKEEKEGINSIVSYNKLANLFILITIILIFNYFLL